MLDFLRRAIDFISRPTHSRTMGIVILLILVTAVSLTVIVAQQQQQTKQHAAEYCQSVKETCSPDITNGGNCTQAQRNVHMQCKINNADGTSIVVECK